MLHNAYNGGSTTSNKSALPVSSVPDIHIGPMQPWKDVGINHRYDCNCIKCTKLQLFTLVLDGNHDILGIQLQRY